MEDMSIVNEVIHRCHHPHSFDANIILLFVGVPKTDGRFGCRKVGRC